MDKLLKVQGHEGLVRDESTLAIINTNRAEYDSYIARMNVIKQKKSEALRQQEELNNIKQELGDLKAMVAELLAKGN